MCEKSKSSEQNSDAEQRIKRRSAQLRANLMRRKAQTRSRRAGEADEREEGIRAVASDSARSDSFKDLPDGQAQKD